MSDETLTTTPAQESTVSETTLDPRPPAIADGALRMGLAGEGALRWAVADLSYIVETVRERRDLSPVAAAALGRTLAASALLLRLSSKTPTRLVLELKGDGPLGSVVAEADGEGNLRGMVGNPRVVTEDYENHKLNVGAAMGNGLLRVLREHPTGNYSSQVELVSGEIAYDVAHYLRQSEQRPSAVFLGVLAKPEVENGDGEATPGVAAAGGLIVEILPGAADDLIDRLEANLQAIPGISWLMEQGGIDQVLTTALDGLDPVTREETPIFYRCRCTRDRLRRHLEMMSEDDLDYLREETGDLEAECVFCGNLYRFDATEMNRATTPEIPDA